MLQNTHEKEWLDRKPPLGDSLLSQRSLHSNSPLSSQDSHPALMTGDAQSRHPTSLDEPLVRPLLASSHKHIYESDTEEVEGATSLNSMQDIPAPSVAGNPPYSRQFYDVTDSPRLPDVGVKPRNPATFHSQRLLRLGHRVNSKILLRVQNQSSDAGSLNSTITRQSAPTSDNSMLGPSELDHIFPEHRVRIFVLAWNMSCPNSSMYPEKLNQVLAPERFEIAPDIYVLMIQEAPKDRREFLLRAQSTLNYRHVLYDYFECGDLFMSVFIRRELVWYISVPDHTSLRTRPAILTKGAVAISFVLFGTSFLVINSHFKSDDGNFDERVQDYKRTISLLPVMAYGCANMISKAKEENYDITDHYDVVFWGGDLNFRLDIDKTTAERILHALSTSEDASYEDLLRGDELFRAQAEGIVFQAFEEGRINFPPTYKYDPNENKFDTSDKNRVPSYTDRILFRSKGRDVSCEIYDSVKNVMCSDHRAVYGLYDVQIKPGYENIPLAAGSYHRKIYIEGTRRCRETSKESSTKDVEKDGRDSVKVDGDKEKTSRVCVVQ